MVSCSLVASRTTAAWRASPNATAQSSIDFDDAMRRLVEHQGAWLFGQCFQTLPPRRAARRQKAFEAESIGGQSCDLTSAAMAAQGTRDGDDFDARLRRRAHQFETRITDGRRACIAHQGHRFAVAAIVQLFQSSARFHCVHAMKFAACGSRNASAARRYDGYLPRQSTDRPANVSFARVEKSPKFPIGVATTYSRPTAAIFVTYNPRPCLKIQELKGMAAMSRRPRLALVCRAAAVLAHRGLQLGQAH